tara:strand:+ start:157 stop:789 length:633 start_codon:yes stop_codon:yes gene_type:complete
MQIKIITFKSKPKETPFAPEWLHYVGYGQMEGIDFKKIATIILKKEKQIIKKFPPTAKENTDGYTLLGDKSLTSRYNYYNIIDWPEEEIKKLTKGIWKFHSLFLKALQIKYNKKLYIKAWANVMHKGEQIKPHLHGVLPNSYLTGHITIQTEESSTYYINPVNQINDPEVRPIKNKVGQITLLPACMPHYTDVYQGKIKRVSIGLDIKLL